MTTYLITATPPTPNGDMHVGHLSGPYLAADVFARYQRMRGNCAVYLCSSDDHQSYVMTTATRKGREPAELAEHYGQVITATLRGAGMDLDLYTSALGNRSHIAFVQSVFRELYDRGVLEARTRDALYCNVCERYLFESFAKGKCPHCGEGAAGNLCEACGRVNDPVELRDPVCSVCHSRPIRTSYRGIFFPLERYREQLAAFYASRATWRPHLRALCEWLVTHGLPDYPVSYLSNWGIPVPVPGFEGHVINVWFEMYPGHIETTRAWARLQGDSALAERLWAGEATLVQFLGYDNSFFNAVLHVATGLALEGRYLLPEHIITNEFYLLDGEKFSTSRNHAIWGTDILKLVQGDALRYYLSRTNPEHTQTNFTYREFAALADAELAGTWNGAVGGTLQYIREQTGGVLPAAADPDLQARGLLGWTRGWLERCYGVEEFSLRNASAVLHAYVEGCADILSRTSAQGAGEGDAHHARRVASLAYLMQGLAYLSAPLLPAFAQQLWTALGLPGKVAEQDWSGLERPAAGDLRMGPVPEEWFPRVGSAVQTVRVGSMAMAPETTAAHMPPMLIV